MRAREDAEALELALIENMAREDLNPIEEARACAALVEELGLTREEVGRRVGRSRVAVSNLMRLLDLPDEAIELLEEGALSEGHGRALLLAEDHGARRRLARAAVERGVVGADHRRARAREQRRTLAQTLPRAPTGCRARSTPTRSRRRARSPRRSARGARRGGAGQADDATAATARSCRSRAPRRRSSWPSQFGQQRQSDGR